MPLLVGLPLEGFHQVPFVGGVGGCCSFPPFLFLRDRPTPSPTARAMMMIAAITPLSIHFLRPEFGLLLYGEYSLENGFESAILLSLLVSEFPAGNSTLIQSGIS